MIELKKFSKTYRTLFSSKKGFSVEDISFSIKKGKILGLLGLNGSGKTTIIKAICGFHYGDEGEIFLTDNNVNDEKSLNVLENADMAMELLGYVPEKSILPPDLFVREFLEYTAISHGITDKDEINKKVNSVIKECSLSEVMTKKIKEISKGYQQRVSFAQAIIHNPPNLILDEPASGLDPAQIIQMRNLIKKNAETKAVLMSTHLLQEVYSLCDEICIIHKGKIVALGTEEQIVKNSGKKNLEEAFMLYTNSVES